MKPLYKTSRALAGRLLRRTLSKTLSRLRRSHWGDALLRGLRTSLPGPWQALRGRFGPVHFVMAAPASKLARQGSWKRQEQHLLARIQAYSPGDT